MISSAATPGTIPAELWWAIAGTVVMCALLIVSIVVTVRHHGWGQRTWARPAVPWFVAAMVVGAATFLFLMSWASSG